jgi:hypothetical protein
VKWVEASFRLPVTANMPVEVEVEGKMERRDAVTGDWRQVVRWRTVVDTEPVKRKKKT